MSHIRTIASSLLLATGLAGAQPAPDANSVLILGSSVSGGAGSVEAVAASTQGFTVVIDSDTDWAARSTADFATFKALIIGDPTCAGPGPFNPAAQGNNAVWGPAVTGNVVIVGTDPTYHQSQGGDTVADSSIAFVAAEPGETGLYITLSCYYHDTAPLTPVPVLAPFGAFTVQGVGCYDDAHIVAVHPALMGLSDASLSNWSCSVHEAFDSFPDTGPGAFLPLVIAENIGGAGSRSFADGSFGVPYVLARGATLSPVACGNGMTEMPEECDDGNTSNGDGCSAQCTIEVATTTTTSSTTTTTIAPCVPSPEICNNAVDDDCDMLVDCVDESDCLPTTPPCRIARDPSSLRFDRSGEGLDYFRSHGRVQLKGSRDVASMGFSVLLSNAEGMILSFALPPGALTPRGRHFDFADPTASRGPGGIPGIFRARIHVTPRGSALYWVKAYGDFSRATVPDMTLQLRLGDEWYGLTGTWRRTSLGWHLTHFLLK